VLQARVLVPFKMIQQKITGLSAWTLDQLSAKMNARSAASGPSDTIPLGRATRRVLLEVF
jgi:hypothetical protein